MSEREVLEVDVLIVGGGPAGLAAAWRLPAAIRAHNEAVEKGDVQGEKVEAPEAILVEKGAEVGSHAISGAVMDPRGLQEVMPDWKERGAPITCEVTGDTVYYFTKKRAWPFLITPPGFHNDGNYIVSLNRLCRWWGEQLEARTDFEMMVMPGFPAQEPLIEDGRVVGVRTGDKGLDKDGNPKSNHEAGADIRAKVTIFAEGPRGSATKLLLQKLDLAKDRMPQIYSTGVKEIWSVPEGRTVPGTVWHTAGYPLGRRAVGGGFVYQMENNRVSLGLVTALDYESPFTDPHNEFQIWKQHPKIAELLAGGKMETYGAKTIPEGGWYTVPRVHFAGGMIAGDSASFMNMRRLKGIHLAIATGKMAVETAVEALGKKDFGEETLAAYQRRIDASWVRDELRRVRNFRQALDRGMIRAAFHIVLQDITGGRGLFDPMLIEEGHHRMAKLAQLYPAGDADRRRPPKLEGDLVFDKLTDVYHSGTKHEEDQPCHLVVTIGHDHCNTVCREEYGNPCQYFCPAAVYEMSADTEGAQPMFRINPSNCVHCKTCDIADPYQVIQWAPPEGGGGPAYVDL